MPKNRPMLVSIGLLLFIVTACTSYENTVSIIQTTDKIYKISASAEDGLGIAGMHEAQNLALFTASKICKEKGFTRFKVLNQRNDSNRGFNSPIAIYHHSMDIFFYTATDEKPPQEAYDCMIIFNQLSSKATAKRSYGGDLR